MQMVVLPLRKMPKMWHMYSESLAIVMYILGLLLARTMVLFQVNQRLTK